MKRKLVAAILAAAMAVSMTACGGGSGSSDGGSTADGSGDAGSGSGVSFTIFNSKSEIQDQFEELAKEYSEAKGVNVEVYMSFTRKKLSFVKAKTEIKAVRGVGYELRYNSER